MEAMALLFTLYLCYLLVFVSSLTLAAGLSLYEKVQLLETNYVRKIFKILSRKQNIFNKSLHFYYFKG